MDKNYIIWNNFNTLENNFLIEELPMPSKAEENKEFIEVSGRNGFLTIDYGTLKPISYEVQLNVKKKSDVDLIKKYFKGSGTLILSNCSDVTYKGVINGVIDFERVTRECRTCVISFELQPLSYVNDISDITLVESGTINNEYNYKSYPYIKVFGTGNGNLYINDETISFTTINEYIELDCELEECYKGATNCNKYMIGDFCTLQEGNNTISWDGNITKVIINPRWRKL